LFKDVPNLESRAENDFQIHSVLIWQAIIVFILSLLSTFTTLSWFSVLFGGLAVVVSTWHVHRSVSLSGGDRGFLLKAAGIRFALFLLVMAVAVYFLKLQPVALIAGMVSAYAAMYVRSLIMIFTKMKGGGLG